MEPTEFEAAVESVSRLEDLWREMVAFARTCGVRRIGYHHLPPPGAPDAHLLRVENDGFGDALLAQYLAARGRGLAVLANVIQNSVRPVYLDELGELVELTPEERAHLAAYRAAGVQNGLGLQVFGPNGRNGIFAIDLALDPPRLPPAVLARLRWGCQAMHLRYCDLLLPTLGKLPSLSSREAEVLGWVVRGKSNAAIGDILGISAHTVTAHVRHIYEKLEVSSRASAVYEAVQLGLIRMTD